MLADRTEVGSHGRLAEGALAQNRSRDAVIEFIAAQLPPWRDDVKPSQLTAEDELTERFCAYLNVVSRVPGWDWLQFRTESVDETKRSRRLDLVASPRELQIAVEGRSYAYYQTIVPVECKRLPTPLGPDRDPREYVITSKGVGGGIQRFKERKHAASHERAAMIAYVQDRTLTHWAAEIEGFIKALFAEGAQGWTPKDLLSIVLQDTAKGLAIHESEHSRTGATPIRLSHLWISMQ